MTEFEQALANLRKSKPPPRRPPRTAPPPTQADKDRAEWDALRADGHQSGSEYRRMAELRRSLMDAGMWRAVYR